MDSLWLMLAALFVGALLTWRLLIGSQHAERHERRTRARLDDEPIHAAHALVKAERDFSGVSIAMSHRPCDAVKRVRNESYLRGEEPSLPLPGCDRVCTCRYAYHEDRRRKDDRRYPAADIHDFNGTSSFGDDLRSGHDRRRRVEPYRGIY